MRESWAGGRGSVEAGGEGCSRLQAQHEGEEDHDDGHAAERAAKLNVFLHHIQQRSRDHKAQ